MTTKVRLNAALNAMMIAELMEGPSSASDLMLVSGCHRRTVLSYLKALHLKGCLHIVSYERDSLGRERSPVYALGRGKDRAKKAPEPYEVTNARWRAKQRLRLVERIAA